MELFDADRRVLDNVRRALTPRWKKIATAASVFAVVANLIMVGALTWVVYLLWKEVSNTFSAVAAGSIDAVWRASFTREVQVESAAIAVFAFLMAFPLTGAFRGLWDLCFARKPLRGEQRLLLRMACRLRELGELQGLPPLPPSHQSTGGN